jgi:hypothetical protein
MIWIPHVSVRGERERFSFVVGMLTDSALARWADVALGYGYRKRPARFAVQSFEDFTVHALTGDALLVFSGKEAGKASSASALEELEPALRNPLLGLTASGAWARSCLERSLAAADSVRPLAGRVELASGMLPVEATPPALSRRRSSRWSALGYSNLSAVVSYPTRVAMPAALSV